MNNQKTSNFPTLYLNVIELRKNSKLSSVSSIRMLGVLFDQNLYTKSYFLTNRVENLIPKIYLKLLYFALMNFAFFFLFYNNSLIVNNIEKNAKKSE